MLEALKKHFPPPRANTQFFDASQIDDPFAQLISWMPVKDGGTKHRTHKLSIINTNRVEFKLPLSGMVACFFVILLGLVMVIGPFVAQGFSFSSSMIAPMLFGTVLIGSGSGLFYFTSTPIVFDKNKGIFWKGRKKPYKVFDTSKIKAYTPLKDIYALQVVSEYCTGRDASFHSYELNLVLNNKERINIVDHGKQKKLLAEAKILASFLQKPLWGV